MIATKQSRTRRVLVVSHEGSRTGAPRVAVEVLRSLAPLEVHRTAVLRWGGSLCAEFREHADVVSLEPLRRVRVLLRSLRPTRPIANWLEQLVAGAVILRHWPDVIYLNTVKSASYVRPALWLHRRIVLHVHELEPLASQILARYQLRSRYRDISLVACSKEVRDNLARITGVAGAEITVVDSTVDHARIRSLARSGVTPSNLAQKQPGRVLVGACGLANKDKGVDQWLSMAKLVRDQAHGLDIDVRFVWVGNLDFEDLAGWVSRLGLDGVVQFTGELTNPYPVIAKLDVFTHVARQDSFPLVVLEAMSLARPVVAFDVGGIGSQVGEAGILLPPGDVEAMAAAVMELALNPLSRAERGRRAGQRAVRLFTIEGLHEPCRGLVERLLDR